MFGLIGGASVLDLTLHDVYAAETVARQIERQTGLQADSWIKTNEQFFTAVKAQTTANTAIRLFVALSVGFGIARVLRVFLLQGGLLGFAGALVGASMGGAALVLWQKFQRNADGTVMFALTFDTQLLVQTLVLASLTGLLAAFAPALRAARLDPVVAIRG
jgi:lipoprotein-releasing system permease protein